MPIDIKDLAIVVGVGIFGFIILKTVGAQEDQSIQFPVPQGGSPAVDLSGLYSFLSLQSLQDRLTQAQQGQTLIPQIPDLSNLLYGGGLLPNIQDIIPGIQQYIDNSIPTGEDFQNYINQKIDEAKKTAGIPDTPQLPNQNNLTPGKSVSYGLGETLTSLITDFGQGLLGPVYQIAQRNQEEALVGAGAGAATGAVAGTFIFPGIGTLIGGLLGGGAGLLAGFLAPENMQINFPTLPQNRLLTPQQAIANQRIYQNYLNRGGAPLPSATTKRLGITTISTDKAPTKQVAPIVNMANLSPTTSSAPARVYGYLQTSSGRKPLLQPPVTSSQTTSTSLGGGKSLQETIKSTVYTVPRF